MMVWVNKIENTKKGRKLPWEICDENKQFELVVSKFITWLETAKMLFLKHVKNSVWNQGLETFLWNI